MAEPKEAGALGELKERVEEAIEEFNRYRSPEVSAKLLKISEGSFLVDFSRPFCLTCGFYDYFDDLRFTLEDRGVKARISKIEEKEGGAIVEFSL